MFASLKIEGQIRLQDKKKLFVASLPSTKH